VRRFRPEYLRLNPAVIALDAAVTDGNLVTAPASSQQRPRTVRGV
jgi:hypothetical protein